MSADGSGDVESMRKCWDEKAASYDELHETFARAVEHCVDLELLKEHLPQKRNAKILDAAGGTARITLPLAKMGYQVTLCDLSPGMLEVARQKVLREGILDKVEIVGGDACNLRFPEGIFDFALCWMMIDAAKELIRVTKKGGVISVWLRNKYGEAIRKFHEDSDSALVALRSKPSYFYHGKEKDRVYSVNEAREFFRKAGVKVIDIYAVRGMLDLLSLPKEVLESRNWDEKLFRQVTEMLLRLSRESSVKGLSSLFVLYGEKI